LASDEAICTIENWYWALVTHIHTSLVCEYHRARISIASISVFESVAHDKVVKLSKSVKLMSNNMLGRLFEAPW